MNTGAPWAKRQAVNYPNKFALDEKETVAAQTWKNAF